MHLNSVTAAVRGKNTEIRFERPVTIIAGPTGAGKTTILNALQVALTGTVTCDGKTRSKPGDVHEIMSAAGEPVAVRLDFEGRPAIERILAQNDKGGCGQELRVGGIRAARMGDAEAMIRAEIGDLARVDVAGLLSREPAKRRAEILAACRSVATPVAMTELGAHFQSVVQAAVEEARAELEKLQADEKASPEKVEETRQVAEALFPIFKLEIDRAAGLLGSAEARRELAKEELKTDADRLKRLQQVIDEHAARAAAGAATGNVEEIVATLASLDAEIADTSRRIGAASSAQATLDGIQRRLHELAEVGSVEEAERAEAEAHRVWMDAEEAFRLGGGAGGPREPAAPEAHEALVKLREETAGLRVSATEAAWAVVRLTAVLDGLSALAANIGDCCPSCRRPLDAEAWRAIEQEVGRLEAEKAQAKEDADDAADVLSCFEADLADAEADHQRAVADARDRHTLKTFEATRAAEAFNRAIQDLKRAEAVAQRARAAVAERQALAAQRSGIELADVSMLETQLAAAQAQRRDLAVRAEAIRADETRQQVYLQAVADRDTLREQIPTRKLAVKGYTAVANVVGQRAVEPLVQAVTRALPAGWRLHLEVSDASFSVERGGRVVPFAALSGGEKAMAMAALAAGMAGLAGNKWRGVLIDGAEVIGGPDWEDPQAPAGLFAAFVEALCNAVEGGGLDQAVITTSRAPAGRELASIESTGRAGVHWMGRRVESAQGVGEVERFDAPPPPESRAEDSKAVKMRLSRGVSAEAMAYLFKAFTGRDGSHWVAATLRRLATEAAVEQLNKGRTVQQIVGLIDRAAESMPVRARADVSAPELRPEENAG